MIWYLHEHNYSRCRPSSTTTFFSATILFSERKKPCPSCHSSHIQYTTTTTSISILTLFLLWSQWWPMIRPKRTCLPRPSIPKRIHQILASRFDCGRRRPYWMDSSLACFRSPCMVVHFEVQTCQSITVYCVYLLVLLMLPDWFYNCALTSSWNAMDSRPLIIRMIGECARGNRGIPYIWGIGANAWMNAVLAWEILRMLRSSRHLQRYTPPSRIRVLRNGLVVYGAVGLFSAMGSVDWVNASFIPSIPPYTGV